jgi:hypothetical protein
MGFNVQQNGGSPYAKLDRSVVVGMLKMTGSRDPDVLHMQKQALLQRAKRLRLYGILSIVTGVISTLTLLLAIFGIPLAIFGAWTCLRASRNIAAVEAGWTDYLGMPAA